MRRAATWGRPYRGEIQPPSSAPVCALGHLPLQGEGFGPAQIGRNSALCGTFGYIYWKLGRSAPVGGRAAQGRPYGETKSESGGGKPPPYGFPQKVLEPGRGALGLPPGTCARETSGRVRTPAPTAEFFGRGTAGAQCAPLQERGREPGPLSAPVCALGHLSLSPLPLRDIIPTPFGLWPFPPDRGNRPLDKGSRPPGGRLGKNKKGQVLDLSLKPQRRSGASHKISLPPFFFKERRGPGAPAPGPVP